VINVPTAKKFKVLLRLKEPFDITELGAEIEDGLESKGIEVEFVEASKTNAKFPDE
jgi:hypothetical protein